VDLLLDTHAYLWFIAGSDKLPIAARCAIEDTVNRKFISTGTLWEITIKHALGKLTVKSGLQPILSNCISDNGFEILTIDTSHLLQLHSLPDHHRDPFDRLIVAQASTESMTIITRDPMITTYEIETIWE